MRLAAYSGYPEVVQLLLDQGANLSYVDKDGRIPLYSAAEGGYAEVVQVLLDKGANPSSTDEDGETPLRLATYNSIENHAIPTRQQRVCQWTGFLPVSKDSQRF